MLQICLDGWSLVETYFIGQDDVVGSVFGILVSIRLVEMFKYA